jgi:microcystin-dependent protein
MSEPFIGEIIMFGGNFAPRSWALCDGQLLPIAQNTALFSILGTTYGGDGRTTFALPGLRGRVPVHAGSGPGLSTRRLGEKGGSETNTLTVNNMPSHNHGVSATLRCNGSAGNANTAPGNSISNDAGVSSATYSTSAPNADMSAGSINVSQSNVGANQAVNNMQPFLAINFIIALQGIYPSRS